MTQKSGLVQLPKENTNDDNENNIDTTELPCWNPPCTYCILTKFQYIADIIIFLNNNTS